MENYCLGLEFLGQCSIFDNYEYSIMNIGVFLGILGVFFTAYQLTSEVHKLRLNFKNTMKWITGIIIISIILCFIGALIPFIPGEAIPLLGYKIFYEIFSASLIIFFIIPLSYTAIITPISLKTDSDFKKLSELSINYLIRGEKYSNAYLSELYHFFNDLFFGVLNGKKHTNEIFMNLFNNDAIIYLTEKEPATLFKIIEIYSKNADKLGENYTLEEFFQSLFFSSLSNKKSFIARELNGEINKYNGIFLNSILEQFRNIHYLGLLNRSNYGDDGDIYANNFLLFWSQALELFFKNTQDLESNINKYYLSIYSGFTQVGWIIEKYHNTLGTAIYSHGFNLHLDYSIKQLDENIKNIYGGKWPNMSYDINNINLYMPNSGSYYINNFLDAVAFGIFDCFLQTSTIKNNSNYTNTSWERQFLVRRINNFYLINKESLVGSEIQKRLNILFEAKILENLTGFYPVAIKCFFDAYGYEIFINSTNKNNIFYKKILKIIAVNVPKLIQGYIYEYTDIDLKKDHIKKYAQQKAKKIFNNFFPSNMKYHENKLYYYHGENLSWSAIDLNLLLQKDIIEIENP